MFAAANKKKKLHDMFLKINLEMSKIFIIFAARKRKCRRIRYKKNTIQHEDNRNSRHLQGGCSVGRQ